MILVLALTFNQRLVGVELRASMSKSLGKTLSC